MPATKHILNLSPVENLRRTRELMLEEAGFNVTSAAGLRDAEYMCKRASFDLIIIGQNYEGDEKRSIATALRTVAPATPILELCRISPEIPSPEHVLYHPSPEDIVEAARTILVPKGSKPVQLGD